MLFFSRKFLFLSVLAVLVSCAPHKKEQWRKTQQKEKMFNVVLFDMFSKTIKEYKEVIQLFKEEKDIYNEMIHISYKINKTYNEIIQKQKLSFQVLEKLREQITALNELLKGLDLPQEVSERLKAIQLDLELVEKAISADVNEKEEQVKTESKLAVEEKTEHKGGSKEPVKEGSQKPEAIVEEKTEHKGGSKEPVKEGSQKPEAVVEEQNESKEESKEPVKEGSQKPEAVVEEQNESKEESKEPVKEGSQKPEAIVEEQNESKEPETMNKEPASKQENEKTDDSGKADADETEQPEAKNTDEDGSSISVSNKVTVTIQQEETQE